MAYPNDPVNPTPTPKPTPEGETPKARFSLFPKRDVLPKAKVETVATSKKEIDWSWVKDWSDLIFFFPVALVGFLCASFWIRKLDPTAQVLSVDNLSVLNWNLMMLFGGSGVIFIIWKIWVGSSVFPDGWKDGLTPYEVMKVKLMALAGFAVFVAFMLTRNL